MPNRILRDYTMSEKVDALSWQAECLFIRLMMKADDFGSFHANTKIIKASCFPLRIDSVRDADISRWMDELQKSGLIAVYNHAEKNYLRITDFRQRLQNMRNKFPDPPGSYHTSPEVTVNHGESPPETKRNESESETKGSAPPTFEQQWKGEIPKDKLFYEQSLMSWGVSKKTFDKMLTDFSVTNGKTHKDYHDYKSHFFHWGNKKYTAYLSTEKDTLHAKMANV